MAAARHPAPRFGAALAITEGSLLVGAPGVGGGAVYIFNEPLDGVGPSVTIEDPRGAAAGFGARLAIEGRRVVVGAPTGNSPKDPGSAHVLELVTRVGWPCEHDGQCASNFCIDGLCCDVACDEPCIACSVARGGTIDGACTPMLCPPGLWCEADRCVDQGGAVTGGSSGDTDAGGATSTTDDIPGLVLDPIAEAGCACGLTGVRPGGPLVLVLLTGALRRRRSARRVDERGETGSDAP